MKGLLQPVLPVLYPNFNIILAKTARLLETSDSRPAFDNSNSDSRPAFDNSKKVDLIRLAGTVAKIKDFLTQSPYENSVLEKVKEEVLNLRKILTQIVKQIYTIEETKAEMRNIIQLVHDSLGEIIELLNSNTPEDVRIWQEYIEELRRWRLNHEKEIRS